MNLNFYSKATLTLGSLRKSFVFALVAALLFVNNSQAQSASALHFDGSNDYVVVPVKSALNIVNAITIEAWIKPTKGNGTQDVISKSSSTSNNGYIFPRTSNGWNSLEFLIYVNTQGWKTVTVPYGSDKRNVWHHVAATYDGYTMKVYIDAVLAGSYDFAGTIAVNNNNLTLGNQTGLNEFYGGAVDDARIFNRAMSACEIASSMFCELAGTENGLVAYYKFNQGLLGLPNPLENTLQDASSTGANGTLMNFGLLGTGLLSNWTEGNSSISSTVCAAFVPVAVTAGALQVLVPVSGTINLTATNVLGATYSWTGPNGFTSNQQNPSIAGVGANMSGVYTVSASVGGCAGLSSVVITVAPRASGLSFDGSNDYAIAQFSPLLNSDAFSVESWIFPTASSTSIQNVVSNANADNNTGFKFPKTNDKWNTLTFEMSVDNAWKELSYTMPTSALNKWSHVAATFDGYFMRIYLNGILVGTTEVTGTYTKSDNPLVIGNNDDRFEYYRGTVDEVRVWSRAVSQCEIINNMKTCELNGDNDGLASQSQLAVYYRFNQGLINQNNSAYTQLADSSGHNIHATLMNFGLTGEASNWVDGKAYGICDYFPVPLLNASANGSVFQTGSTAKLFSNYGNNDVYNWTGPNSFATTTQNPVLNNVQENQSGTYTVTTPYVNCVVTASTRIKVSDLPQIIAAGPTSFCPQGSVSLSTANVGNTYQWFLNDVAINGANTNTYVATAGGNYSVRVTNGTQVIVSAPLLVTVIPDVTAPVPDAALPTLNVTAPATVTTVPTATDACRGVVNGTTTDALTFTHSGTYTITWSYNDGNGNTSTQTQTVVVARPADVTPPVLTVPANMTVAANWTTCNAVVTFAATATEESEDPTVTIAYSQNPGTTFPIGTTVVNVTATDAAGNTSNGSFSVTVTASTVSPITGTTTVCMGSTTTLSTATTGGTWSSANSAIASVNASGVVTGVAAGTTNIIYTNSCGVTASAAVTVNALPAAPTVAAVNNCGTSTLTASNTTGTILWSNGATTSSITVSSAGTYSATQTVNGCASAAGSATAAPKALPATPSVTVVNNCGTSTLTSNAAGTILWNNGASTASITVSSAGTYTVTQTVNGCTSAAGSGVAAPKAIPSTPAVTVADNCGTSTLTSNAAGTILWSNGASTASITVSSAGTYTVTQTANGCTSAAGSGVAAPKAIPSTPTVTVANNCGTSTLTSNAAGTILWNNGATTASITVSSAGTYTVTQTVNGCTSAAGSGVAAPKALQAAPVVTVTNNCGSTTLTSNVSGSWSNGSTGTSITVTSAGSYTVTATNAGGCSAATTNVVTVNANPTVNAISGNTSVVAGTTTQLSSTTSGGVWSSNSANATVNASGLVTGVTAGTATITYTVTTGAGCSASVNTVVTVTPAAPTCTAPVFVSSVSNISINAASTQCAAAATYTASVSGTTPTLTYTFSGATTGSGNGTGTGATFNVGTTTVTIKAVNNCGTASTSFSVIVKDVTAPTAITKNITVALDADGNATVTPAQVNNGSYDNCGAITLGFKSTTTSTPVVTGTVCATTDENGTLTLTAPAGATITAINFASYGTPNGTCGSFTVNASCNAANSKSIVEGYALGRNSVSIPATNDVFGDPCSGTYKRLYVQATYTMSAATGANIVTNGDFTSNANSWTAANLDYVGGWKSTGGNAGAYFLLNSSGAAANDPTISQTLTGLVPGQWYTVSGMRNNIENGQYGNASALSFGVSIDNGVILQLANTCKATWAPFSVQFKATSTTHVLTISAEMNGDDTQYGVDNISVAAVATTTSSAATVSTLSFDCSDKGVNTVTLAVTDASGNVSYQNATVTVIDNMAPTVTAVPAQAFCGTAGSFTVPALATNDNCGVTSITYAITGATSRTGTTNNATGTFNIGTSTITWTVKDASGNTTTSTTTVVVGGGPVATIAAGSSSADFCSEILLTGSSNVSGSSYKWLSGTTVVGTSNQFSLGQASAEGVYQLVVTSPNGCASTAASYTYNKQNLVSSYTILATGAAVIGKYNKVASGSVGITTSWGYAYFKGSTAVNGANSFVKAPYIYKSSSDNITRSISGVASVTGIPAMQYNTSNANSYSKYSTGTYTTVTLNSNYKTLTIRKGTYATLTGTIFGTIDLEEGASVRFTNSTVNIDKLLVEDGARDGYYSYVRFAPNSSVRVSTQVSIGSQVLVNPDNYNVTFFMGDKTCSDERFTVKGADTKVIANIIMPDGKLLVTSTDSDDDNHGNCGHNSHSSWNCPHNGHNHKACDHRSHNNSDCNDDVYMTGTFVVEYVESKGNTVIWNSYQCGSSSVPVTVANKTPAVTMGTASITAETAVPTSEEELKIIVMPNPSSTYFTLKFESKYETPINMRVMDANGRVVDAQTKIGSNSTIKVGANYASGTYYAEMIQGGTRKVVQLIKVRG